MQFELDVLKSEQTFHFDYFQAEQISLPLTAEPSPTCFMYTNYLLKTVSFASPEEAVASLLPCFWVYREVGKNLIISSKITTNPYQAWIALYASDQFNYSVEAAIAITNELGAIASEKIQTKMISAFLRSTQLECLFWESAYHLEKWQI